MKLTNEEKQDIKISMATKFSQVSSDIDGIISGCEAEYGTKERVESCVFSELTKRLLQQISEDDRHKIIDAITSANIPATSKPKC